MPAESYPASLCPYIVRERSFGLVHPPNRSVQYECQQYPPLEILEDRCVLGCYRHFYRFGGRFTAGD